MVEKKAHQYTYGDNYTIRIQHQQQWPMQEVELGQYVCARFSKNGLLAKGVLGNLHPDKHAFRGILRSCDE